MPACRACSPCPRWPNDGSRINATAAIAGSALIASAQLESVHTGHHQVENGDVVGLPLRRGGPQQLERALSRSGFRDDHAPGARLMHEDPAVRGVVVDDEDPGARQTVRPRCRRSRRSTTASRIRGKPERRALPGALSTPISPPISSTSCLEIARPSPVPPYLRVVEPSAWANGWNSRAARRRRCRCRCRGPRSAAWRASASRCHASSRGRRPRRAR